MTNTKILEAMGEHRGNRPADRPDGARAGSRATDDVL